MLLKCFSYLIKYYNVRNILQKYLLASWYTSNREGFPIKKWKKKKHLSELFEAHKNLRKQYFAPKCIRHYQLRKK